jgi:hypothetical protein
MSTDPDPEVIILRLPAGRPVAYASLPEPIRAGIRAAVAEGGSGGDFLHRGRLHVWELAAGPRPVPGFYGNERATYHVDESGAIRLVAHRDIPAGRRPRIRARLPKDARPLTLDPDRARELLRGADD